jgi:hypothetical protein
MSPQQDNPIHSELTRPPIWSGFRIAGSVAAAAMGALCMDYVERRALRAADVPSPATA